MESLGALPKRNEESDGSDVWQLLQPSRIYARVPKKEELSNANSEIALFAAL